MQYNLFILRKKHKISQKEMADVLKINIDTYGRKERGELQFKMDEMFLISKFFDKIMDDIFLSDNCINNA